MELKGRPRRASSVFYGNDQKQPPILNFDCLMKFVLIGDSSVGKSALIGRFADNLFVPEFAPTIGIDFKVRVITVGNNRRIKLQVWDTAGQERFRAVNTAFYRNAMGIFIVYDISNYESFKNVQKWVDDTVQNSNFQPHADFNQIPYVMLVGNKLDCERKVTTKEASDYATKNNMFFMETSAKDNTNVDEVFITMTKLLYEKVGTRDEVYVLSPPPTEGGEMVDLLEKPKENKKKFSFC